MTDEPTYEDVLDTLGSEVNRHILALASEAPRSAEDLAGYCDVSQPTIYRRLDTLSDLGLVEATVALDDDGNHYKRFRTTLEETHVAVEDGQFRVDLELARDADYTGKFVEFWRDLERGAEGLADGDVEVDADADLDPSSRNLDLG
ncbi:MAG: ArsR/SmtB family transcription factor [Halobacteriaceae archaeon]